MTKDEALKMAIEALEESKVHLGSTKHLNDLIQACKEALEQPAPKNCTPLDEYIAEMEKDPEIKQLLDIAREDVKKWSTQPILAPSWQGLSDDEKLAIIRKWKDAHTMREQELIGLGDAFEQALKEKNNAM